MRYTVETEVEEDDRWIAEVPALSGVMTYGKTREEALRAVEALALRMLADRIEHGESVAEPVSVTFDAGELSNRATEAGPTSPG